MVVSSTFFRTVGWCISFHTNYSMNWASLLRPSVNYRLHKQRYYCNHNCLSLCLTRYGERMCSLLMTWKIQSSWWIHWKQHLFEPSYQVMLLAWDWSVGQHEGSTAFILLFVPPLLGGNYHTMIEQSMLLLQAPSVGLRKWIVPSNFNWLGASKDHTITLYPCLTFAFLVCSKVVLMMTNDKWHEGVLKSWLEMM